MGNPILYRGLWPQNVSKLAKYAIRFVEGMWKITVLYEAGEGLLYLAVEGTEDSLVQEINAIKQTLNNLPGGAFYVNEYRHVLVPVQGHTSSGSGSHYYYAGRLYTDLEFGFEGNPLITKPIHSDGTPMRPGEKWIGPRPGIPYVLSAGAGDIYFETPALTDDDPPRLLPMTTRRVQLSKILSNRQMLSNAVSPIAAVRGHQGGRFYVNEHGAIFTPAIAGDGNGINYIYCGQINRNAWFPDPLKGEMEDIKI